MNIELISLLKDNYAYLLTGGDFCAVVDPAEGQPVIDILQSRGLKLDYILNTHHHGDHTGGNLALKEKFGCKIAGPATERIPGIDIKLKEGDEICGARIIETPGHTAGHICFYFAADKALFCGDTLFSMGCGRLFEGTAEQMWKSLQKIASLPDDTRIYCGHEYTHAGVKFCLSIEPENMALQTRLREVETLRAKNLPTIPSTVGMEKKTNVFLRAKTARDFADLRAAKDRF